MQRVALARAIALDFEMIMYDEPFVGQDPIGLGVLISLVKRLNQALGLTSLVVSHDLRNLLSIADHVIMIANTRVAFEGSPQGSKLSEDPLVQHSFMGSLMDQFVFIFRHFRLRMRCNGRVDC